MAEEIKDASYALPRSMLWSIAVKGALGLVMTITICFCIGDVATVLTTPIGYVFIQMFYNTTSSLAATNAMSAIVIIVAFFSVITIMASASRQLFAFARDDGLPYSEWLSDVCSRPPPLRPPLMLTDRPRLGNSAQLDIHICCPRYCSFAHRGG